jgi:uncharacterized pyridoxal phosphate-containing UPF0001 family protein
VSCFYIDRRVERARKQRVPIYIEINIGSGDSKAGIKPVEHEHFDEYVGNLVRPCRGSST